MKRAMRSDNNKIEKKGDLNDELADAVCAFTAALSVASAPPKTIIYATHWRQSGESLREPLGTLLGRGAAEAERRTLAGVEHPGRPCGVHQLRAG